MPINMTVSCSVSSKKTAAAFSGVKVVSIDRLGLTVVAIEIRCCQLTAVGSVPVSTYSM